jgi:DNA-binding IclR family transcriptional regulator
MRTRQSSDAVSVIDRVTVVLGCFRSADESIGISELARRADLPKSTVSRLVSELVKHRYLERDESGVRLGLRLFELGELAAQPNALRRLALPTMAALRDSTGHGVHLSVLEGSEVVCVGVLRGRRSLASRVRVGDRRPAYPTAPGTALLAGGASSAMRSRIDNEAFRSELERVRAAGVAFETDDPAEWWAACAVLGATGMPVAAISVWDRPDSFDRDRAGSVVRAAALGLSRRV